MVITPQTVQYMSADNLIYTLMRRSKAVSTGQERKSDKSAINATNSFSIKKGTVTSRP
jgi:hypothetical protein